MQNSSEYSGQAVVAEDEHWVAPNLTGIQYYKTLIVGFMLKNT